jgi:tripartite-type tricarboxylate transporter receptor subunit TctC
MRAAALAVVLALAAVTAHAQTYPSRAVRMFVGYPAGGGMDGVARVLADKLAVDLGQPVLVENRAGASASIAAAAAASAAPDGHTLYSARPATSSSRRCRRAPCRPGQSFAPVAPVGVLPARLVVSPGFPRERGGVDRRPQGEPGKHSYGSPGVGTVHHLAFEQFRRAAGLDVVHIPYRAAGRWFPT